jgi:4-hydroxy-tetrahydrodipicolinate synthase
VDFGRLISAMVTPFDHQLSIDWNQTAHLIEHLVEQQHNDGLVVAGTTGESPTLTDDEKLQLFEFVVRKTGGRAKIIAGTGSNDTLHSIHLSKEAEKLGVDGIMLVAPYYNRTSQEGLYRHFVSVADQVSLPIVIYNIPSRTGINILPETILRLANHPHIVAVKESSGDLEQMSQIIAKAPPGFRLYSGDDNLTLPVLSIGGHGIISVASHIVGKIMKQMIHAYLNGQVQQAAQLHARLTPIFNGLFYCPHRVPNPVPIKYALKANGMDCGGVRLPLVEATSEEAAFIEQLMLTFEHS